MKWTSLFSEEQVHLSRQNSNHQVHNSYGQRKNEGAYAAPPCQHYGQGSNPSLLEQQADILDRLARH
jgi:hypothetical protein